MRLLPALCLSATFIALAIACGKDDTPASAGGGGGGGGATADGTTNANTPAGSNLAVCTPVVDSDFAPNPLEANACSQQMYATYGDDGFQAVNANIIAYALKPEMVAKIGSSFQDRLGTATPQRVAQFTEDLLDFLKAVYSGDMSKYPTTAPGMVPAHAGLKISFAQYNAFINEVVVPALADAGVASGDITNCFAPPVFDPAFMKTVVTCK